MEGDNERKKLRYERKTRNREKNKRRKRRDWKQQ